MSDFWNTIISWLIDVDETSASLFAIAFSVNTWTVAIRKHHLLTSRTNKQLAREMARYINESLLGPLDERERQCVNTEDIRKAREEVANVSKIVARLGETKREGAKITTMPKWMQFVLFLGMIGSLVCLAIPFFSRRYIAIVLLMIVPCCISIIHICAHIKANKAKKKLNQCKENIIAILETTKTEQRSTSEEIRAILHSLLDETSIQSR